MPKLVPIALVPRNQEAVVKSFGRIIGTVEGGERGRLKFLLPWQYVGDKVFTGFVSHQVLQGERKLHFAGGGWIDFEEAVIDTRITDSCKALYDTRYTAANNVIWTGVDGAAAKMCVNANDALQSYVAGKKLQDAIYLSGPEVTDCLTMVVPNVRIHPAFAQIADETGIEVCHVRFSGVKLSENYVTTMEELALERQRLKVVHYERGYVLKFLKRLREIGNENGHRITATEVVSLFKEISFAQLLQEMSGQLIAAPPAQMFWMWPILLQLMQGKVPAQQASRGGRDRG